MPSPWLAVGAETDPLVRARQLQRSWERLLGDASLGAELPRQATAGLRPTIVESWRRSLAGGLDPTELLAPIEVDLPEVQERWLEHPLGSAAHVLAAQLRVVAEETNSLVVVTDASGLLLHIDGAEWLKDRAREMNLLEGARYSETADGTNGIGTALAADHPLQVFAFEHFNQRHHHWVCSGAPVHDPVSGRIVGLIDVSSLWKSAHPRTLELVATAARAMERCLLDTRRDQDARLRRRYSDLMTRSTDMLVNADGYVLDGDGPPRSTPLDVPEGGGEIVLDDGSLAVAEPLGHGEAHLVRRRGSRGSKPAPVATLERAEVRAHELAAEQAAVRQVAALVAQESSPDHLFAVVANQVARVFDVPLVRLVRYEPDCSVVVAGFSEGSDDPFPIGSRWPLGSPGVLASVRHSGRPARIENFAQMAGQTAAAVRRSGIRSAVASPVEVEGRLWGAMVIASPRPRPLPEDAELRLTDFTELVATAIANAESRAAVGRLAEEQAALRRVATLVARGVSAEELFSAVSDEVGRLVGAEVALARFEPDGSGMLVVGMTQGIPVVSVGTRWELEDFLASTAVYRTGRPARSDHTGHRDASGPIADSLRQMNFVSTVAAPITVEGSLWGVITVNDQHEPLPPDTEERVGKFTELVATAIADAESRAELGELLEELAALGRVATLVARGVSPEEIFNAVSVEVGRLFGAEAGIARFEADGPGLVFAGLSAGIRGISVGTRWELEDFLACTEVYRTGRPARSESRGWQGASGPIADVLRQNDPVSMVAAPIVVEGDLWGAITVADTHGSLPPNAEERVAKFTEVVAIAIANANSRTELAASEARTYDLAREQASLRRVATLVAEGASADKLFAVVAEEVADVLDIPVVSVQRFEADGTFTVLGIAGETSFTADSRWLVEDERLAGMIVAHGRPARNEDYSMKAGPLEADITGDTMTSTVGVPIVVEGGIWGFMVGAAGPGKSIPDGTEERLEKFTELLGTAVANAQSRAELAASRARIIAAGDDARRRIERNLHDGAQQRLVTLAVALRRAEAKLPGGLDEQRMELTRVVEGLASAVEDLRELSRGIHPSVLTEGGLSPALKALGRRSSIRVKLDIQFERRLPDQVEVATYYTVSEALTNASKHSGATCVWISLRVEDDLLHLSIRDDGAGGADASQGSGIIGLTDRIEALGGTIQIDSPLGGGTRIAVEIPIADSTEGRTEPSERPWPVATPITPR
jgi:signal transduction histidine kinase